LKAVANLNAEHQSYGVGGLKSLSELTSRRDRAPVGSPRSSRN